MYSTKSAVAYDKLHHVDGLRGIACLMVVFSHLALIFYPGLHDSNLINNNQFVNFIFNSPLSFFYSCTAAVFIFFTLSGFILSHAFMNGKDLLENITPMVTKRYFRLAIPAVVSCFFCLMVLTSDLPNREMLSSWIQSYRVDNPSIANALYSGSISAFLGDGSSYNPVLWTMKIELIGSFLTYFLCTTLIKSHKKSLIILFFGMMFFLSTIPQKEKYGYIAFLVGIYLFFSNFRVSNISAFILLILGIYAGGIHYGSSPYIYTIYYTRFFLNGEESNAYILFNFISGVIITTIILKNVSFKKTFGHGIFTFMGKVSFSVYLFHLPILVITSPLIFNYFYGKGFGYATCALSASIVSALLIYALSNLVFKMVDKPSMRLSSKIASVLFINKFRANGYSSLKETKE
ncbi:acyltransferase [Enterobacter asburiae]|uniref:acyltransferase family protein n=1 Tax=Enterobacter asburiae TaxID=61645 RepID=UPI00192B91FF|nr:acyltransferase [Enterobacter asburiae]MBL5946423.1 acyltransferase [Enterobacter asburiae]